MRFIFQTSHFKKPVALALASGLWLAVLEHSQAQPQFVNFDFEMASNLPAGSPAPGSSMSTADAFPGWTTFIKHLFAPPVLLAFAFLAFLAGNPFHFP
jgi:hypothetical protein